MQEQHHKHLLSYFSDHFLYGASSELKAMMEGEIKKLGLRLGDDDEPKPKDPLEGLSLVLPTYVN
jgi:hypothetical protein